MIKKKRTRNYDADSAVNRDCTASASEATGMMQAPPRSNEEAEAAEELFPLEAPQTGSFTPVESEKKDPGTVRPAKDGEDYIPHTIADTEFGTLGDRELLPGYFSLLGKIDPANNFVNIREPKKEM